jgi:hypothetical protein
MYSYAPTFLRRGFLVLLRPENVTNWRHSPQVLSLQRAAMLPPEDLLSFHESR